MKVLIPCSTGLDSIYVLWKQLSTTQNDVTAVFVKENNETTNLRLRYDIRSFGRTDREGLSERSSQIMDWLKTNVRDFTYVEIGVDPAYLSKNWDEPNKVQTYVLRHSINQINSGVYDRLILCTERETTALVMVGRLKLVAQAEKPLWICSSLWPPKGGLCSLLWTARTIRRMPSPRCLRV